ncbi:hypothetical protein LJC48_01185 [Desulfovibrio sp. OttesenSCG-928-C06]|nr:hypothetical protein [Desulfovibrio sp. OttesenSCG-928-C06]
MIDFSFTIAEVESLLKSDATHLRVAGKFDAVVRRAQNDALSAAKNEMSRMIRARYAVKTGTVKENFILSRADSKNPLAKVRVEGDASLPLSQYSGVRKVYGTRKIDGISRKIVRGVSVKTLKQEKAKMIVATKSNKLVQGPDARIVKSKSGAEKVEFRPKNFRGLAAVWISPKSGKILGRKTDDRNIPVVLKGPGLVSAISGSGREKERERLMNIARDTFFKRLLHQARAELNGWLNPVGNKKGGRRR